MKETINVMKSTENGLTKVEAWAVDEEGEFSDAFSIGFGEMTEEQSRRIGYKYIMEYTFDECPEVIRNFVNDWRVKIKDKKYLGGSFFTYDASIIFGFGDRVYKIGRKTLFTNDGILENAAKDILLELKEIGANYGMLYSSGD